LAVAQPLRLRLKKSTIAALKEQKKRDGRKTKPNDIVFPKNGDYADWDWWLKPALKEAKKARTSCGTA
jgi:hypothetical protein